MRQGPILGSLAVLAVVVACTSTTGGEDPRPFATSTSPPTTAPTTVTPDGNNLTTTTTGSAAIASSVAETTQPRCPPDPFDAAMRGEVKRLYPGRAITAHAYDIGSGCEYSFNEDNRQPTASVFKVMVMAGAILEAQAAGRPVNDSEMERLTPMITQSANWPVRSLWNSLGASPWFRQQRDTFGLDETTVTADGGSAWGLTHTSAADQVKLIRQVLLGEYGPLNNSSRQTALDLMTSVVSDQTWGVTAGVPSGWVVAQKNGFAGRTINSIGWADPPGPAEGYAVAILSTGWPSHAAGIEAVERVSRSIAEALIQTVALAR